MTEAIPTATRARAPRPRSSPRPPRGRRRSLEASFASKAIVMAVLILSSAYFLLPLWWLIVSSTKDNTGLFGTNGFWFSTMHLTDNIAAVFTYQGGNFGLWMLNSAIYAGVGGLGATLIGAACGYGLAKFDFPGRGIVFGAIISGVLLPGALLTIPLFLLFTQLGLVNTYWAVIIPSLVSPFAVYLARVYATDSVPDDLLEAARVDGAGEARIFFTIVLRLMKPALVTIFLFSFVGIWNNFFLSVVMLSNQKLYPITLGLVLWFNQTQAAVNYTVVIAGCLIAAVPLVIAFLSLQRFWESGLSAGAIKG